MTRVDEGLRPALREVAALVSSDDERAAVIAALPEPLRTFDAGVVLETTTVLARLLDGSLPARNPMRLDIDHQRRLAAATAEAWSMLKRWPGDAVGLIDLAPHRRDFEKALSRLVCGTSRDSQMPEVVQLLGSGLADDAVAMKIKPAAWALGVTEAAIATARSSGLLKSHAVVRHGLIRIGIDRMEVQRLGALKLDRVGHHRAAVDLGLPTYGLLQLLNADLIEREHHPWLVSQYDGPIVTATGLRAFRDRLTAAARPHVERAVSLASMAMAYGGGPKPWAAIVRLLLAGDLPFALQEPCWRLTSLLLSRHSLSAILALPPGGGSTEYSQAEAHEVLNLPVKHADRIAHARLPTDGGGAWRLNGKIVHHLARERISRAELMARTGLSVKTLDALMRARGIHVTGPLDCRRDVASQQIADLLC